MRNKKRKRGHHDSVETNCHRIQRKTKKKKKEKKKAVKFQHHIEHRPSFSEKRNDRARKSTFSWLCLIQKWEDEHVRNNKASIVETETKKKVHVCVQHESHEKIIVPKKEQLFENENSLPDCVKKFLKRKRQGQSLSVHQRSALMKMIRATKRRRSDA